jgi:glycosyltransferase involved in cell wall biosynthesis
LTCAAGADPVTDLRGVSWVVIPAFREVTVIAPVVAELVAAGWRVVVVDDGSHDGTGEAARRAGAWVLSHAVNLGQGAALRTGFAFALTDPGTRFVVTFDADGQHETSAVRDLLLPLARGEAEVTLGSRFLDPRTAKPVPAARRLLLRCATWLARWTTGLKLTDTHNGLRGFTVSALRRLQLQQDRMAHASEIQAEIARRRLAYLEVPVDVSYSPYSLAKGQRLVDAVSILWDLLLARMR